MFKPQEEPDEAFLPPRACRNGVEEVAQAFFMFGQIGLILVSQLVVTGSHEKMFCYMWGIVLGSTAGVYCALRIGKIMWKGYNGRWRKFVWIAVLMGIFNVCAWIWAFDELLIYASQGEYKGRIYLKLFKED